MDDMAHVPENSAETPSIEEGYQLILTVSPDGFSVSDPQPMASEAPEDEMVPSLTEALKQIVALVQEHPVTGDDEAQLAAGYGAGKQGMGKQGMGKQGMM